MDQLDPILIALPLISLCAFYVKGIAGIGTTSVIVALCSFIIDPKIAIILASFINMFGGLRMVTIDRFSLPKCFWIPVTITMIIGSILGALTLAYIDNTIFKIILGTAFFLAAIWFFTKTKETKNMPPVKERSSLGDLVIGTIGGFCGGFIGINTPPLVLYFGSFLDKRSLRRLLVIILFPAAIAQSATFWWSGVLNQKIMLLALLMLPGMFIGTYLGNKSFHFISENMFRKILAILLFIVSIRLVYLGIGNM